MKPCIAHSMEKWLPITMTWIYTQLKYTDGFSSFVLANAVQNLELFPWKPIYAPDNQRLPILRKIYNRIGLRTFPKEYNRAIQEQNPSILHSHFGYRGWYDLPIAKKYELKHVITFYGSDISRLPARRPIWRSRYRELFDQADLFLCEGPYMAQAVVNLGCPQEKVRTHRLGVDLSNIPFIPRKIGEDGLIKILIAGTFREKKGIPYALEAVGKLRDSYPNILVTVIGDSAGEKRDEEEKRKIYRVIERYKLKDSIRMLGFQTYQVLLREAYDHHIFLSPSVKASDGDTEGGAPVTIIEMAASGMPVVSTRHCDIPEIIQHKSTGLLSEERDVDELVENCSWLTSNADAWCDLVDAARRHIEQYFDARIQGRKLGEAYRELLSK